MRESAWHYSFVRLSRFCSGLERKICPFRIARVAEERHLLIHRAANGASPGQLGFFRQEEDQNKGKDPEEQPEEEPRLDLPFFPVRNVSAQNGAGTPRQDDDCFHGLLIDAG